MASERLRHRQREGTAEYDHESTRSHVRLSPVLEVHGKEARMIPAPKLRALREALESGGEVLFKNGSKVEREVDFIPVPDAEPGADGEPATAEEVHFVVTRPAGGIARYNDDEDDSGLRNAYAMALDGPTPKPQPSGDAAMFGDDPPW